jgi:hypothetical protein
LIRVDDHLGGSVKVALLDVGRRVWIAAVGLIVVGLAIGVVVTLGTTREYRASATDTVVSGPLVPPGTIIAAPEYKGTDPVYANSGAAIATSEPFIDGLGLSISSSRLLHELSARSLPETNEVVISVADPNADHAARYANAVAAGLTRELARLSTAPDGSVAITATQTGVAQSPTTAVDLPWVRNEVIGGLGGLGAALIVVAARAVRRRESFEYR